MLNSTQLYSQLKTLNLEMESNIKDCVRSMTILLIHLGGEQILAFVSALLDVLKKVEHTITL